MGEKLRSRLFDKLKVKKNEIYEISGPIDLTFLKKLAGAVKGHEKCVMRQSRVMLIQI